MNRYRAEDFDERGNLRARKGMWWALFLLAHPWWLLAFEMSVAEGNGRVLSAVYPTEGELYAGLVCSVSVFFFLFVYPFRLGYPRLMMAGHILLILSSVVMMVRVSAALYTSAGGHDEELWLSLCCLHLVCLIEVWPDRRNREVCCWLSGEGAEPEGRYAGSHK